jgi:leucyl aminopeptidase
MEWTAQFLAPGDVNADWLITLVWQGEPLSGAAAQLDRKLDGMLTRLLESGDITGKLAEVTPLLDVRGLQARRVLVAGLGKKEQADFRTLVTAAGSASKQITTKQFDSLALLLPEPVHGLTWNDVTLAGGVGLAHGCEGPGLRKSSSDRFTPAKLLLIAPPQAPQREVQQGLRQAEIESNAVSLAREMVNTPPCDLYPETFAKRATEVAGQVGLNCTVFDEQRLESERMAALLGVGQGSDRPPRLVVLRYDGKQGGKTLGLVGKGVTFDSGGLSLKPTEGMLDMKCDMAGAATVLAAMQAVARLKLPVNLLGVLALVENMPSGKALKLGDVLRARNGKTIEIHNTDAEGRLILADALAYAVDQNADCLVDLATLTGACLVALGTDVVGLMSNNEAWSKTVRDAAQSAGELVWPLPMFSLYSELIKSNVADIKNTGGKRWAGAITAAKFLEEFVGDVPWVHLDIAGPAFAEDDNPRRAAGGTGVMVRTLVELARSYRNSA